MLSHLAEENNIRLQTSYPADVEIFKFINGDERRYLQILVNFLSNAIKFSHRDSSIIVALKVDELAPKSEVIKEERVNEEQIDTTASQHQILFVSFDLSVQDFGYGMSPDSAEKIFIDFAKMEEHASVNSQGVGLGLSICKSLVEQMSGAVRVESEQGVGTTFVIKFRTTCKVFKNFMSLDNSALFLKLPYSR